MLDSEKVTELEWMLSKLKNSECWCEVGIGNPAYKSHSEVCERASLYVDRHGLRGVKPWK